MNINAEWTRIQPHGMEALLQTHQAPSSLQGFLVRSGSCIAGSFALKAADQKSVWVPQDLDVWVPNNADTTPLLTELQAAGYTVRAAIWDETSLYGRFRKSIQSIRTATHPTRTTIQLIVLVGTDRDAIIRGFDLDVCRYYYDGIHLNGPAHVSCTVQFTAESILQQTHDEQLRSLTRLIKYAGRGYRVTFPPLIRDLLVQQFNRFSSSSAAWNRAVLHTVEHWNDLASKHTTHHIPYFVPSPGGRFSLVS
jgi:hypothetical protein